MAKVHWHGWVAMLMTFQKTLHKIPIIKAFLIIIFTTMKCIHARY
jgi:hypothetical protein